ncbi:hydrogenase subunit MbhD domain-containing protein [Piscinibacter sp.]|uniref:hydrogenase subunit MbhD domain-containing protein n=1 Tax=Piscinibacter sp. TaxID=1903157 RepID=UPI002CE0C27E|nr:hydrogenase subunit MbhD domain-containing protein [Albitalea sp.]HUG25654.1 hydrogenase subunit MbhD domain-containing protein [Albitalea sp.]
MTALVDLLLGLALLGLAIEAVAGASLFRSIVMFVVFGVVLALVWARLGAPDLALAETAIGAGLTGALLLVSYRRLVHSVPRRLPRSRPAARLAAPLGLLTAALVLLLGSIGFGLPDNAASAGREVLRRMPDLPIANPVTAVLLLFRGYDTLLEATVLLAAYLGARLAHSGSPPLPARTAPASLPLVAALLAVVVPLAVLVSVHLLHAGGDAPGGAFQAGAVLAAAGVLLVLCGRLRAIDEPPLAQRALLVLGVLAFAGIGLAAAVGGDVLALPGTWAIYAIESALLLSIALTLVLLFAAGGGLAWGHE